MDRQADFAWIFGSGSDRRSALPLGVKGISGMRSK
jgi:hypothetical protein